MGNFWRVEQDIDRNGPYPLPGEHVEVTVVDLPLDALALNDSFFVPTRPSTQAAIAQKLANQLAYARRRSGAKFTVKALERGLRVWRDE